MILSKELQEDYDEKRLPWQTNALSPLDIVCLTSERDEIALFLNETDSKEFADFGVRSANDWHADQQNIADQRRQINLNLDDYMESYMRLEVKMTAKVEGLEKACALLNSMIAGGEQHSKQSQAVYDAAMNESETT